MDLTRLAIEKNRVTAALLGLALLGGVIAFRTLPRAEDPGFVIRTAQVITSFPGASPARVEDLVTHRLERAIREYLAVYNENPKPFVWTKTADQILETIARYRTVTSDSGH